MNELANKITISPTEYFSKLGINLDDYLRIENEYKFPKNTHELIEKVNDNLSIIYLLREFELRTYSDSFYSILSRKFICGPSIYPLCSKIKNIPQHEVYDYVINELPWYTHTDFIFDKPYLHHARRKKYMKKYPWNGLTFIKRKDIDILSRCRWMKYVADQTTIDVIIILSSYNKSVLRQRKSELQSDIFPCDSVYALEMISDMKHVKVSARIFKIIFKGVSKKRRDSFGSILFPKNVAYDKLISICYKFISHHPICNSNNVSINGLHRRRCNIPEALFTRIMKNIYKILNNISCIFVLKNLTRLSLYY